MTAKKAFFEKFREAAASVLPIVIIVAVMFLSDVIWGENPFFTLFTNSFKHIGTESLTK